MRHLVFRAPGQLAWEEAPDPEPSPGSVVIRPLAVARCDLDPAMALFGVFPGPYPVGHETTGEVVAVGEGVEHHVIGDRVAVPFQVSCGACDACREHRFAACRSYHARAGAAFGFGEAGGGHGGAVADLLLIPSADHLLQPAPSGLDPVRLALLTDNTLDAYRCVAGPLARTPGADVLVVGGAGASIGLYTVALAKALGSHQVRYVDGDPERCAQAERLGATAIEHRGEWPKRFDTSPITVDNTGDPEGLACVIRSTEEFGTCTTVAVYFAPTTPLPMLLMYTRGITLNVSRVDSRRYIGAVLELTAEGRFDPLAIDTNVVPFDDAAEAWTTEPSKKLVLTR